MDLKCKMILEEYKNQKPDFVQLGEVVHSLLAQRIKDADIMPLAIEHRVKAEDSLAGKLELKGEKYSSLEDITDILGARVICFFSDEIDVIAKIVEDIFEIDRENSIDKRAAIRPDAFGYLSLHYICSFAGDSGYPENICGKKFEIQIRSALQHTWAVINHDLGYKSDFGVPRMVTRNFSRIASILEIADEQFVKVREDINAYVADVRAKIAEGTADDITIDNVSLNEYVKNNKDMLSFMKDLSVLCDNAEIRNISAEPYIQQLTFLGVGKLGDLSRLLSENKELALKLAERMLENTDLDILSSNVGLRFLCRAELITKKYDLDAVTEFMKITFKDEQRAKRQAKRVLSIAETING